MNDFSNSPDPDLFYSLYREGFKPQVMRMAMLLDVFTPLASAPASAEGLAQACGCAASGMIFLLDYLVTLELVEKQDGMYSLSPTAAAFLVRGSPSYAGDWILLETSPEFWLDILQSVRSGKPCQPAFPWDQDAWLESYRQFRLPESTALWSAAGIVPGKRPALQVLDLACGCGVKSFVLAQADPATHITALDRPAVLAVASDLAGRMGIASQVTCQPADLFSVELGQEQYDAALLGQITYYLTARQNTDLFQRVCRALKPGGVLVVDAVMAAAQADETLSLYTLVLWAVSGGAVHSFEEYRAWLLDAGFSRVTKHAPNWLSALH